MRPILPSVLLVALTMVLPTGVGMALVEPSLARAAPLPVDLPETPLPDVLPLLSPAPPVASQVLRIPGADGVAIELRLDAPVSQAGDGRVLLGLPPEAGRKVDAALLDLTQLAADGLLDPEGHVPVLVRSRAPVLPAVLDVTGGFARLDLRVGRVAIADLATLALDPAVERVHLDGKNTVFLADSVPLIRADAVHARNDSIGRPIDGRGITIAILDTGVDHTHPDLGGCLGPACKVVGARSFVPDGATGDDHGHGTHVAATAAGLRGVAPGASILNYRVLQGGGGLDSWIIAAIENATLEGADIISMSLGGPGATDTPLAQAVDWAVLQGVVVVSAAGNDGCDGCVGEPATALSGIAVGATTKADELASFTSRGPVYRSDGEIAGIKPDLAAPGVQIVAAVPTSSCALCDPSGQRSLSGTSMATPHVAGAAALLLQAHPTWTPDVVKGTLASSSVDLTPDANGRAIGLGRLDALAALDAELVLSPVHAWVGLALGGEASFEANVSLVVRNLGAQTKDVELTSSFPGVASILPATFTLAPGAVGTAIARISLGTDALPSGWHEGSFRATSGPSEARGRASLLRSSVLDLTLPPATWVVHAFRDGEHEAMLVWPGQRATLLAPAGTYDFITLAFDPCASGPPCPPDVTFGLRELVEHSNRTSVDLRPTETFQARVAPRIGTGPTLDDMPICDVKPTQPCADHTSLVVAHTRAPISMLLAGGDPRAVFHLERSSFTASRTFLYSDGPDQYITAKTLVGIEQDLVVEPAGTLHAREIVYQAPSGSRPALATRWCQSVSIWWFGNYREVGDAPERLLWAVPSDDPPIHVGEQRIPLPCKGFARSLDTSELGAEGIECFSGGCDLLGFTPSQRFEEGAWRQYRPDWVDALVPDITRDGRIVLQDGASHLVGRVYSLPDAVYLYPPADLVYASYFAPATGGMQYRGQTDGSTQRWRVVADGVEVRNETLRGQPPPAVFPPATTLEIELSTESSFLATGTGRAVWRSVQTDTSANGYFPRFFEVEIADERGVTTLVAPGTPATLRFRVDEGWMPLGWNVSARLTHLESGDHVLLDGLVASENGTYEVALPDLGEGDHDLLLALHAPGIEVSLAQSPAFTRGVPVPPPSVTIVDPRDRAGVSGVINVTGTASGGRPIALVEWSTDQGATWERANGTDVWSFALDTRSHPDGRLELVVRATDDAGDKGAERHDLLVSNDLPPHIEIHAPAEGAELRGEVTFHGTASDPDGDHELTSVRVSLDGGTTWHPATGISEWSFVFHTRDHPLGERLLCASAASGYISTTTCRRVVLLANEAPTLSIVSPAPGEIVHGTLFVSGSASDEDPFQVHVAIDDGPWTTATGSDAWQVTLDVGHLAEGHHLVHAYATDGQLDSPIESVSFRVERPDGRPIVRIHSPTTGASLSGIVVVEGTAEDEGGLEDVEIRVNAGPWRRAAGLASWSYGLDTRTLPDGVHAIDARAFDGETYSILDTVWFGVDNTPDDHAPSVQVRVPSTGAELRGIVVASGIAVDPEGDLASVEIRLDEGEWRAASGREEWSFPIDTRTLADGVHTLSARASDGTHHSPVETVWFGVSNTDEPPTVAIGAPRNGDVLSGTIVATGTAEDPEGELTLVEIRLDEGPWQAASGRGQWSLAIDTTLLANGVHTLSARASDATQTSAIETVWFEIANTDGRPSVRIDTPTNGATLRGVVVASGDAADPEGALTAVEVRLDDGPWQLASGRETWTFPIDTTQLQDGVHAIEARALDPTQASLVESVWFLVDNVEDGHAPRIRIERPAEGATVSGVIRIEGAAHDPDGEATLERVEVSLDLGATWRTAEGAAYWKLPLDTSALPEGPLTVLARATDGTRWSDLAVVNLTVVHPPPPRPDVAVLQIEILRQPISVASAALDNDLAERRLVRVHLENLGDARSLQGLLDVRVLARAALPGTTQASTSEEILGNVTIPALAPGARVHVELEWDTTGNVGDQRILARLVIEDADPTNDQRSRDERILVGGLGGVARGPVA